MGPSAGVKVIELAHINCGPPVTDIGAGGCCRGSALSR
jgi:hypothetical protein